MLFILTKGCVCLCVSVIQSCLTLCSPMDCSLPGSSVHGILQTRILEWVDIPSSRGSSQPRDRTWCSCIAGRFFTVWVTREAQYKPYINVVWLARMRLGKKEQSFLLWWLLDILCMEVGGGVQAVKVFELLYLEYPFFTKTCSMFLRRHWRPTPVLLPGKSHGWRSLAGCSPWGH